MPGDSSPNRSTFKPIADALAAILGLVGIAYVIGATTLSFRYQSFGLFGQATAAVTPREDLLRVALATLLLWVPIGALATLLIVGAVKLGAGWRAPGGTVVAPTEPSTRDNQPDHVGAMEPRPGDHAPGGRLLGFVRSRLSHDRRSRCDVGLMVAAAVLLAALACLDRVWPLIAFLAASFVIWVTVRVDPWTPRHLAAAIAATVVVLFAYEADRTSFSATWSCVSFSDGRQTCGVLVADREDGIYLVQPKAIDAHAHPPNRCCERGARRLLFIPRARVVNVRSSKTTATAASQDARNRHRIAVAQLVPHHLQ